MANRHRGEVEITLDGRRRTLRLTLGALAELETGLGAGDVAALAERLGSGRLTARDMTAVLGAGLRGAGEAIEDEEVAAATLEGGALGAAQAVAHLLEATFGGSESASSEPA